MSKQKMKLCAGLLSTLLLATIFFISNLAMAAQHAYSIRLSAFYEYDNNGNIKNKIGWEVYADNTVEMHHVATALTCVNGDSSTFITLTLTDGDGEEKIYQYVYPSAEMDCRVVYYDLLTQLEAITSPSAKKNANQTGKKASSYKTSYTVQGDTSSQGGNNATGTTGSTSTSNSSFVKNKLERAKDTLIANGASEKNIRLKDAKCYPTQKKFTILLVDQQAGKSFNAVGYYTTAQYNSCITVLWDIRDGGVELLDPNMTQVVYDGSYYYLSTGAGASTSSGTGSSTGSAGTGASTSSGTGSSTGTTTPSGKKSSGTCQYTSTQAITNGKWVNTGVSVWQYKVNNKALTGWQFVHWSGGNNWFYFDKYGDMLTDLQEGLPYSSTHGTFYFDNSTGAMQTGWKFVDSQKSWYYFDPCSGAAVTGWNQLEYNGKTNWYYFSEDGYMYSDQYTPDGYYVNSSGAWDGKGQDSENAESLEGGEWACTTDGECSYFNETGDFLTGWKTIGGEEYYFNEDGMVQNGWVKKGDAWYFYSRSKRVKDSFVTDEESGDVYYFYPDGRMAEGIVQANDDFYYCFTPSDTSDYAAMQRDTVCKARF